MEKKYTDFMDEIHPVNSTKAYLLTGSLLKGCRLYLPLFLSSITAKQYLLHSIRAGMNT